MLIYLISNFTWVPSPKNALVRKDKTTNLIYKDTVTVVINIRKR